ncbi:MAG: alpha/beta hydrolase [Deltaproteobacteria bacterium]|nr:alpha/beta hydrolase [Deltaproteobacteria bacterium]
MPEVMIRGKIGHYETGRSGLRPGRQSIIFVHGAGGGSTGWQAYLNPLDERLNTLAIDLPGHGQSHGPGRQTIGDYVQWLDELIQTLELPEVYLAGHSMGGAIAMSYARAFSQKVMGLILVGTGARLRVTPQILGGIRADFEKTVDLILRACFAVEPAPATRRETKRLMLQAGPEVMWGDFTACDNFDMASDLVSIQVPCLILCGQNDVLTPPKYSEYLHQNITGSRLAIIPQAGHLLMVESYSTVLAHLKAFLQQPATS